GDQNLAGGDEYLAAGEEDLAGGEEDLAAGEESITGGEEDLAGREEDLTAGEEDLAASEEDQAGGDEHLAGGEEDLTAGEEDLAGGDEDLAAGDEELACGDEGRASASPRISAAPRRDASGRDGSTAPFQPLHPTRRDLLERGVQLQEHVPEPRPQPPGHPVDDAALQLGVTHALPELVGQRDEQLLQRHLHLGPSGVREAAAGDLRPHAVLEQQALAVGLVRGAGAVELLGVQDLARVVEAYAQPDEWCVDPNAHRLNALEDGVGRLAHQPDVGQ